MSSGHSNCPLEHQVMKGGSGWWSSTKAGQFQHYGSGLASLTRPTNSKFPPQSQALRIRRESKNQDWLKTLFALPGLSCFFVFCLPWNTPMYAPHWMEAMRQDSFSKKPQFFPLHQSCIFLTTTSTPHQPTHPFL